MATETDQDKPVTAETLECFLARAQFLIKTAVDAERDACAELANTSIPAFEVRKLILARGK